MVDYSEAIGVFDLKLGIHTLIILKFGMEHWVLEFYQIPSNDDPKFTLDLFQLWFLIFVWENP